MFSLYFCILSFNPYNVQFITRVICLQLLLKKEPGLSIEL